ncbi:MAG: MarR family transcriptional regulator [Candidatus Thalassarchaeaceae archaeon]|nr:MarR family transcriptional regulator [Candidatus Thalassarchaeaceae archaeon]
MSEDELGNSSDSMNQIAKLTLGMATFMLFLLILVPFTVSSTSFDDIVPYLIYSLFLTSIGILIGISMTWLLNNNNEKLNKEVTNITKTKKLPILSSAEKIVVNILQSNENKMWQAELVRQGGFTNSKASRLLSSMENRGLVRRVRDGMGKRVELTIMEDNT